MTGTCAPCSSIQLLAFVASLGPLLALAGAFEALAALGRRPAGAPAEISIRRITHRYMFWLVASLLIDVAAAAFSFPLGSGDVW